MTKKDKEDEFKISIPKNKLFKIIGVFIAVVILMVAAGSITGYFSFGLKSHSGVEEKTLNFVNTYMMYPGMEAEIIDSTFENGMYKINILFAGESIDLFVTEDERYLFLDSIDMEDEEELRDMLGDDVEIDTEVLERKVETQQEIEQKTLDFIREYLLIEPNTQVEFIETNFENNLYEMFFDIEGEIIEVFVSEDGRYMYLGPIDMDMDMDAMMPEQPATEPTEYVEYDIGEEIKYNENGQLIIHYFYAETCPYCTMQREVLDDLEEDYGNEIEIISYNTAESENSQLVQQMAAMHGVAARGVPMTFIGGEAFTGLSDYGVLEAHIVNCIETVC